MACFFQVASERKTKDDIVLWVLQAALCVVDGSSWAWVWRAGAVASQPRGLLRRGGGRKCGRYSFHFTPADLDYPVPPHRAENPAGHGSKEVKGKTHTYYQVLIDARDCPHIVSKQVGWPAGSGTSLRVGKYIPDLPWRQSIRMGHCS